MADDTEWFFCDLRSEENVTQQLSVFQSSLTSKLCTRYSSGVSIVAFFTQLLGFHPERYVLWRQEGNLFVYFDAV